MFFEKQKNLFKYCYFSRFVKKRRNIGEKKNHYKLTEVGQCRPKVKLIIIT